MPLIGAFHFKLHQENKHLVALDGGMGGAIING